MSDIPDIPDIPAPLLDEATEVGEHARENEPRCWSAHYGAVAEHVWRKAYAAGLAAARKEPTE